MTTVTSDEYADASGGNVDAQWDLILRHGYVPNESDNGLVTIRLRQPRPELRRPLEDVPRSMKLVTPALVEVFRSLTTAKAPWPLYLWGPAGAGKTRACLALCDFVGGSRYFTVQEACDAKMRQATSMPWDSYGVFSSEWPALVVMDELGVRTKIGDLEYSVITEVWESRERHGKGVAVYVSNLSPQELADAYDDRIASRVLAGTVFKLDGEDRRQKR